MDQQSSEREREGGPALAQKGMSHLAWAGAIALTLGVRLYLFHNYYTINNDGILYIEAARHFWEGEWGKGLASFYPPLFPLMITAAYPITGEWELAGQFWPLLLGILMIFPLFGLLYRVYGYRAAQWAIFFYSVSPYLARLSLEVRSEVPYAFFLVLALYRFQLGLEKGSAPAFFSAGVSSGLAYLERPEGIGIVMLGVLFLLASGWIGHRWQDMALKLSVLILGFVIFSAPYMLYLRWDTGHWVMTRKTGLVFSMAVSRYGVDREGETRVEDTNQVRVVDFIASHPLTYLKKVFLDSFRSLGFYFEALHYSYLPFLLIGWIIFFRGRFWEKKDFLFLILIFFYLGTFALLHITRRYGVPLIPVSLGWVASGYLALTAYLDGKLAMRWSKVAASAILVFFIAVTLPKTLQAIGWDKYYLREAGMYLREKPGNPTIVTTNGRVAFYAEGRNRVVLNDLKNVSAFLAVPGGDYLALDQGSLQNTAGIMYERHGWRLEREFSNSSRERLLVLRRIQSQ
jgi:4-amino-4-deoxy-L-arabinose transferase-like glycosyltransferase